MKGATEEVELSYNDERDGLIIRGRIGGGRIFVDVRGPKDGDQGATRIEMRCPLNQVDDVETLVRSAVSSLMARRVELMDVGVDI